MRNACEKFKAWHFGIDRGNQIVVLLHHCSSARRMLTAMRNTATKHMRTACEKLLEDDEAQGGGIVSRRQPSSPREWLGTRSQDVRDANPAVRLLNAC